MSRDSKLKWTVIAAMIMADIALIRGLGLEFNLRSLWWPAGFTLLLGGVGVYYLRRRELRFVMCTNALLHLVLFSSSYTVLMYACATWNRPLIDPLLVRTDAMLGLHLPAILDWVQARPALDGMLSSCYDTLLPQTAAVVGILGLLGDRRPLELFLQRFMLAAMLTVVIFSVLPAAGPFASFGYPTSAAQARYLEHFTALRSGDMRTLALSSAEGLITFPSFHTTWALLMALAFGHRPALLFCAALLNGAIVVSTVTTGWHYASDTIGGLAVCAVTVGVCHLLGRWTHPGDRHTHRFLCGPD